ncbi:MAG: TRAP transporter small permease [Dehalococcoidia bacterium]
MNKFEKVMGFVTDKLAYIGMAAIVVCVALVVSDVAKRSLGFGRISGIYELVELVAAVILSVGIGYLTFVKGHVAVGLLVDRFSARKQAALAVVTYAISLAVTIIITWGMFDLATYYQRIGAHTFVLRIPLFYFIYVVAGALVMTSVVLVKDLAKAAITVVKGKEAT